MTPRPCRGLGRRGVDRGLWQVVAEVEVGGESVTQILGGEVVQRCPGQGSSDRGDIVSLIIDSLHELRQCRPIPLSEESLVELAGQACPPLLRCDRGRLGKPFGLQRRLGVGPRVWRRGDRKRLARLVGGSRVGQQRDAPDQRLGCIHGPSSGMTAAPRMSSSRQPRCRAWSTAVISGSHRRLDWRVSAWSAPMSSVSRVDRTVAKVWPVSAWAVTVGVSCRLIRHHTAAAA